MANCRLNNAYNLLKEKGMSDTEIYNVLKEADNFNAELTTGISNENMSPPLIQIALNTYNPATQKAAVDGLVGATEVEGMNRVVFVAKMVEQLGGSPDDQKMTNYVLDTLKEQDKGAYEETIKTYATMAFNGKGSKTAWTYIDTHSDAKALATEAVAGMKPDEILVIGDVLGGRDPYAPGTKATTTEDKIYSEVKKNTGFDAVKLIADTKKEGKKPYYTSNKERTPEVVALFASSGHTDALTTLEEFYNKFDGKTSSEFIKTVDSMGDYGVSKKFGSEVAPDKVLKANMLKSYYDFNNKYTNVNKDIIGVNSYTGVMGWEDKLGDAHTFNVVDGTGYVWNPSLNNGEGGYDKEWQSEIKEPSPDGYKSGTWTFNRGLYAETLLSGELDSKTEDEFITKLTDLGATNRNNRDWWNCVGTWCGEALEPEESGGGGGGGGGGGSSGGSGATAATENTLYVECNVPDATVTDKGTGKLLGEANNAITLKMGSYIIQVKATGYKTRETPVEIGKYPVAKTINLVKIAPSISTFIRGIGGIQNLTKTKYLYLYCVYKMRTTSMFAWKQFADTIDSVDNTAFPTIINKEDVLYVYYLVNGDISSAQALVDAGKVTLLDADGDIGGGNTKIENQAIGVSGGI